MEPVTPKLSDLGADDLQTLAAGYALGAVSGPVEDEGPTRPLSDEELAFFTQVHDKD